MKKNVLLVLTLLCANVWAQQEIKDGQVQSARVKILSENKLLSDLEERDLLIKDLQNAPRFSVGLATPISKQSDGFENLRRYMPMFNYVSDEVGSLITFIPVRDTGSLQKAIKEGRYDFLYIDAPSAVFAYRNGYRPVVKRNLALQGAWLVKDRSTMKDIDDLVNKKVGHMTGSVESVLSQFILKEKKIDQRIKYIDATELGKEGLLETLKSDAVDAIVLDLYEAKEQVRLSGGNLRVLAETNDVPEAVLMAKNSINVSLAGELSSSLVSIRANNRRQQDIDSVLKGNGRQTFSIATIEDLLYARRVVEAVGLEGQAVDSSGEKKIEPTKVDNVKK